MDSFQIIVLIVATVLLIIIFATMGIVTKYYSSENAVFPPIANTCPDLWTVDASGNCVIPGETGTNSVNKGGLYDTNKAIILSTDATNANYTPGYASAGTKINFSDNAAWGYGGKSAICNKNAWAKKYGIAWDGVSNVIGCK